MSKPKRILQVVTVMDRAGLETMLMNYYRNIDRDKIQFDFLVHSPKKGDYDDEIKSLGGRIFVAPSFGLKSAFSYRSWLKKFLDQHPEYEVMHSHLDAMSAIPLSVAKAAGIKRRYAHSHNNGFDNDLKKPIRMILKQFIPKYATGLFACSDEAGKFMFGKNKFTFWPNAIDLNKFKFSSSIRSKIRKQYDMEDGFVVGHIGRFNVQKNHQFLIDAFNSLLKARPDSKLILVGDGPLKPSIEAKVNSLGLSDKVVFTGNVDNVNQIAQAMDIFVLPSLNEGLPLVAVEAQAAGLNCYVSDRVSDEISLIEGNEFIELDEARWSDALAAFRTLSDKDRTENNRIVTKTDYNIKEAVKKAEAIYNE